MNVDPKRPARLLMGLLGLADIAIGIFWVEFLVPRIFSADHQLQLHERILIDLAILGLGALLYLNRGHTRYVGAILFAHSLVFTIVALESLLQMSEVRARVTDDGRPAILISEELHHSNVPNQTFKTYVSPIDGDWGPVENHINSLGLRGPEIPLKRDDEVRILLLGDSYIEAQQIPYEHTVGQQLQQSLDYPRLRVIQYGVFSYSPILELNWLIKRGLSLGPDIVVLFLYFNDFFPVSYPLADASYAHNAVFDERGFPVKFDVAQYSASTRKPWNDLLILEHLRALLSSWGRRPPTQLTAGDLQDLLQSDPSQLDTKLERYLPGDTSEAGLDDRALLRMFIDLALPATSWNDETRQTVGRSLEYLDLMAALLREKSVRFIVTLVPSGWNVSLRDNREIRKRYGLSEVIVPMGGIEDTIRAFCDQNGIEYLDLVAALTAQEAEDNQPLYLQSDSHWNPRGHQIVARVLLDHFSALARD